MSKVLICGYGSVGSYLVDFLLKDHRINQEVLEEIHIMSRKSIDEVTPRLEISVISAGISERYIPVKYHSCSFDDIEGMSKIINEINPKVVVYTGRFVSGIKYGSLSYPRGIGYGVWIPFAVPYIYNLMKAVKLSGVNTKVINTSFPDGVNKLLKGVNLSPYCGAGNISHLIPRIRRASSKVFGVDSRSVLSIDLVCSHFTNTYVSKEGVSKDCPSLLKIYQEDLGYIISDNSILEQDKLKQTMLFPMCKDNSTSGHVRNQMVATDCAEIVRYIVDYKSSGIVYIPGLNGMSGGCRCYAFNSGININSEWSADEIEECNSIGLYHDGVVIENGIVEFTKESIESMKKYFNIDYPTYLHVSEMEAFAKILRNSIEGYCK